MSDIKLTFTKIEPTKSSEFFNHIKVEGVTDDGRKFSGTLGMEKDGRDADCNLTLDDGSTIDDPFELDWDHIWDNPAYTDQINKAFEDGLKL